MVEGGERLTGQALVAIRTGASGTGGIASDGVTVSVAVDLESGLADALVITAKEGIELARSTEGGRVGASVAVSRASLAVAIRGHEVAWQAGAEASVEESV